MFRYYEDRENGDLFVPNDIPDGLYPVGVNMADVTKVKFHLDASRQNVLETHLTLVNGQTVKVSDDCREHLRVARASFVAAQPGYVGLLLAGSILLSDPRPLNVHEDVHRSPIIAWRIPLHGPPDPVTLEGILEGSDSPPCSVAVLTPNGRVVANGHFEYDSVEAWAWVANRTMTERSTQQSAGP
jgi:hypothetical protein